MAHPLLLDPPDADVSRSVLCPPAMPFFIASSRLRVAVFVSSETSSDTFATDVYISLSIR